MRTHLSFFFVGVLYLAITIQVMAQQAYVVPVSTLAVVNTTDVSSSTSSNSLIAAQGEVSPDSQYTLTGPPKLSTPYPNPATGEVRIDYTAGNGNYSVAVLRLYDFLGKEVKTLSLKRGTGSVMLDLQNLQPGIYFYSLEIDKKIVATKRLVVSR